LKEVAAMDEKEEKANSKAQALIDEYESRGFKFDDNEEEDREHEDGGSGDHEN
jgi:hypothetical protein